jgi:hypothetical protein
VELVSKSDADFVKAKVVLVILYKSKNVRKNHALAPRRIGTHGRAGQVAPKAVIRDTKDVFDVVTVQTELLVKASGPNRPCAILNLVRPKQI